VTKQTAHKHRETSSGRYVSSSNGRREGERTTLKSAKGQIVVIYRDSSTGRYTTQRSADRIRTTSARAAESLRRLAKR
jgi:hypothetical protein